VAPRRSPRATCRLRTRGDWRRPFPATVSSQMGKTALITGASSGLGFELARLFAGDGHDLVVVARRRDHLEALATRLAAEHGVAARIIAEDLADPIAPRRIVEELKDRRIEVEFLVNSAGFGASGPFV